MKERLFGFTASETPMVKCLNCGWKPGRNETRGLLTQQVFDLSCGHECEGVESYAAMCIRDAIDLENSRTVPEQYLESPENGA